MHRYQFICMNHLIFSFAFFTIFLSGCAKSTDIVEPNVPPRNNETPLFQFAYKQDGTGDVKPGFSLVSATPDYPTEYGVEFTVSRKGILYAVGFRMPQAGKYFVSLWDAVTKNLILRDSVDYTDPSKFFYKDFSAQNKEVSVAESKKYMASVHVPRSSTGAPQPYYTLFQPGVSNWVPFTRGNITITANYFKKEDFPAFPDTQIFHRDVLNGLVDIGYYATEK